MVSNDGRLIAYLTRNEFLSIHAFCQEHDIEKSGPDNIYDVANGGAISIWSREEWMKGDGSMHCTLSWERSDARHPANAIEALLADPVRALDEADEVDDKPNTLTIGKSMLAIETRGVKWIGILCLPGDHENDPRGRWGEDRDWTASLAQEHLRALYLKVLGNPMPENRFIREDHPPNSP